MTSFPTALPMPMGRTGPEVMMAQVSPLDGMFGIQLVCEQRDGGTFDRRVEPFEIRTGPPGHVLIQIRYDVGSAEQSFRVLPEAALALPTIFLFDSVEKRDAWIARVERTWGDLPDNAGPNVVSIGTARLN